MLNTENNTNVMTKTANAPFVLPDQVSGDFDKSDLAEDMDGLQMSFIRAKIPGGGVTQFELPGDDASNPSYVPTLQGVILFNHPSNAYWPEDVEPSEDNPPLCQAVDGKTGYGEPGGSCATCAMNKFGSSSKGGGKACKNMRVLYLLRSGEMMPIQLNLPPTSLRPFREFVNNNFVMRQRATYGSLVEIGLKREEANGYPYGVATFKKLYDFTGEELERVKAYAATFREQAKESKAERIEQSKAHADELVEVVEGAANMLPDNEDRFSIIPGNAGVGASVIDGEREALPA